MNEQNKKQLWAEIEHIFDSGVNELRVFNMVQAFIESRYQALGKACVSGRSEQFYCWDEDALGVESKCKSVCEACRKHRIKQ